MRAIYFVRSDSRTVASSFRSTSYLLYADVAEHVPITTLKFCSLSYFCLTFVPSQAKNLQLVDYCTVVHFGCNHDIPCVAQEYCKFLVIFLLLHFLQEQEQARVGLPIAKQDMNSYSKRFDANLALTM